MSRALSAGTAVGRPSYSRLYYANKLQMAWEGLKHRSRENEPYKLVNKAPRILQEFCRAYILYSLPEDNSLI